jgi:hypothetical protein
MTGQCLHRERRIAIVYFRSVARGQRLKLAGVDHLGRRDRLEDVSLGIDLKVKENIHTVIRIYQVMRIILRR